ncbi:MurR/RpiR family transcriptional regulator [Lactococcus garvieae]|uniref:MurR/RpiR family transcriptional regulator n=1 Tax=Lactococcus garvieae TaxID=1363 RepID=UPI00288E33C0|nr:MurR/RpiR family transcriptional regulator [Lactococcus garvieae]MDT2741242.1 MurR/RpiR family transcriptional regulator [Lactococcus garvieae]
MLSFQERVKNKENKLTELEEDLVHYILKNKEAVSQTKIVILSQKFYTVPNTITRFCKKLGYENFSEFKMNLKQELATPVSMNSHKHILLKNFELIDKEREMKVVQLMQRAKSVNFYALDQTGLLTKMYVKSLFALDDKFQFFEYQQEMKKKILNSSHEVFFFVSLSGETPSVLELAELAKSRNHKLISLTNLTENSLVQMADIPLYCLTQKEEVNGYDTTDKTPLLLVLQSLYYSYRGILHI